MGACYDCCAGSDEDVKPVNIGTGKTEKKETARYRILPLKPGANWTAPFENACDGYAMSDIGPLAFVYDASRSVMSPIRKAVADRHFVDGQRYDLIEFHERTPKSHKHFFAALHLVWQNLDHRESERFLNYLQFRKHCLIRTGFCSRWEFACPSNAEAERLAVALAKDDIYAIIVVEGKCVVKLTANSQTWSAMDKKTFNAAAEKVLDYASALIGVKPKELAGAVA